MSEPPNQSPQLNRVTSLYRTNQASGASTLPNELGSEISSMEVMLFREFAQLRDLHRKEPQNYIHVRDFGTAMYTYHQLRERDGKISREILVSALGCFVYAYRLGGGRDTVVVTWLKKIKTALGLPSIFRLDSVPAEIPVPPPILHAIDG